MRFIGAMGVSAGLFALVAVTQLYLTRDRQPAHVPVREGMTERAGLTRYRLRLTTTFDAKRDPFALRGERKDEEPVRLLVRSGQKVLLHRTEDVRRGEAIEIEDLVFEGERADLFVLATPAESEQVRDTGVRIALYRADGVLCDERTLWMEPGDGVISRRVVLSLRPGTDFAERGEGGPDA